MGWASVKGASCILSLYQSQQEPQERRNEWKTFYWRWKFRDYEIFSYLKPRVDIEHAVTQMYAQDRSCFAFKEMTTRHSGTFKAVLVTFPQTWAGARHSKWGESRQNGWVAVSLRVPRGTGVPFEKKTCRAGFTYLKSPFFLVFTQCVKIQLSLSWESEWMPGKEWGMLCLQIISPLGNSDGLANRKCLELRFWRGCSCQCTGQWEEGFSLSGEMPCWQTMEGSSAWS